MVNTKIRSLKQKMKSQNVIVFDMDGVIIDVSASYRDVVRHTARLFFQGSPSSGKLPNPLFSLADLAAIKQSGGLNNDWDLTAKVIDLLFSLVKKPDCNENIDNWKWFKDVISRCDVSELADFLKTNDRPLTVLYEYGKKPRDQFVSVLYSGDVGSGNIIKQIFQEIYLGKELFESVYRLPPKIYKGQGYIFRETLLIEKRILAELCKNNFLAIATGRPRQEADIPLDYFDIRKYFKQIYTLDDCIREEENIKVRKGEKISLSKPHPFMLDAIADTIKGEAFNYYYIGDMPDDMEAASRSKVGYYGVGLIFSAPEKENLRKKLRHAGADYIIESIEELNSILEPD